MSATYAIDSVQHLVRTHVSGVVTSAQLASMYAAMSADPAFSSTYFQLADWREVTSLEVQPTAVRQAAGAHPFDPGPDGRSW